MIDMRHNDAIIANKERKTKTRKDREVRKCNKKFWREKIRRVDCPITRYVSTSRASDFSRM
jgi:hypothetical protein